MMNDYYIDPSGPNPFEEPAPSKLSFPVFFSFMLTVNQGVTLDDLKAELARADKAFSKHGDSYAHEITPCQFIFQALEVEEQQ